MKQLISTPAKKKIKITILSIIGIVFTSLVAIILALIFINPNNFKPQITKAAYNATGRNLSISGDIKWSFYPILGVELQKVKLSNPSDFTELNLVSVDSAKVSLSLLALLHKQVKVSEIYVDGMDLKLIKKAGKNNWTFVSPLEPIPSEAGKPSQLHLELNDVKFTNTNISYDDYDTNVHHGIKDVNLVITTGMTGKIIFDKQLQQVLLNKVNLNYDDGLLIADINAKLDNFDHPVYSGNIKLNKLNLNKLLDGFGIATATRKNMSLLDDVSIQNNEFSGDENSANLNEVKLAFAKVLQVNLSQLMITNFKDLQLSTNLDLSKFSANEVLKQLGKKAPKIVNQKILDNVSLTTSLTATTHSADLPDLKMQLGSSNIAAKLKISSFSPLVVANNIAIDHINVNDFKNVANYQIPLSGLNLSGNLNLTSLSATQHITASNVVVRGMSITELLNSLNNSVNTAIHLKTNNVATSIISSLQVANLVKKLHSQVDAAFKTKDYAKSSNLGSLNANIVLKNGVISPSSFSLSGNALKVSGSGTFNTNNSTVNYKNSTQIVLENMDPLFQNIVVLASISGSTTNSNINIDWASIQQQIIHYAFSSGRNEVQKGVSNGISQIFGKKIKQSLGESQGNKAIDTVSDKVTNLMGAIFDDKN